MGSRRVAKGFSKGSRRVQKGLQGLKTGSTKGWDTAQCSGSWVELQCCALSFKLCPHTDVAERSTSTFQIVLIVAGFVLLSACTVEACMRRYVLVS